MTAKTVVTVTPSSYQALMSLLRFFAGECTEEQFRNSVVPKKPEWEHWVIDDITSTLAKRLLTGLDGDI